MSKKLIYDFDGTLTRYALPKFEILEKCGLEGGASNPIFLNRVKEFMKSNNSDFYVSIYKIYFEVIKENGFKLVDSNFCLGNNNVCYNDGVINFLQMIINIGSENYVLSSGLKVYLDSLPIANLFKKIYGTTFIYENHEAVAVDYLMSDKSKVDAIKDINKANANADDCSDIIYVGDGLTDFYAMEFVSKNGGLSIFVYKDENSKDVEEMRRKGIVSEFFQADFTENSNLTSFIRKQCKSKHYKN